MPTNVRTWPAAVCDGVRLIVTLPPTAVLRFEELAAPNRTFAAEHWPRSGLSIAVDGGRFSTHVAFKPRAARSRRHLLDCA